MSFGLLGKIIVKVLLFFVFLLFIVCVLCFIVKPILTTPIINSNSFTFFTFNCFSFNVLMFSLLQEGNGRSSIFSSSEGSRLRGSRGRLLGRHRLRGRRQRGGGEVTILSHLGELTELVTSHQDTINCSIFRWNHPPLYLLC